MNLVRDFLETAARHPGRTAVIAGNGKRISYSGLAGCSAALASHWRNRGLSRGDRVLIAMPVGIELYCAIAALWRIGAVVVFPEPALGLGGLKQALRLAKPKAFLADGWYRLLRIFVPGLWKTEMHLGMRSGAEGSDFIADLEPDHPALISFTSGSTGEPKGIERSHGFLRAQNACVADLLRPVSGESIDLVAFPVFVIANLGLGITSVLPDWKLSRHDVVGASQITELIMRHRIARLLVPPSICETLSEYENPPKVEAIFTGGGPVFPDLLQRLMRKMPQTNITAVYGSTEAEPIAHLHVKDIGERHWQAMCDGKGLFAGKPIPQTRIEILDDEIVVTGEHVNKSYLDGRGNAENKIDRGGEIWHRTGDAGSIDEDGNLWLRGRWSAKAGGLFPFEVEVAARSWPGVHAAALVPQSDPPLLSLEGSEPDEGVWQDMARSLANCRVIKLDKIPLDPRHRSKVDYTALRKLTEKHK